MKLPLSLLRRFVETPHSAEEIGEMLTMLGFELEGIEAFELESLSDDFEDKEKEYVLDLKVVANRGDGLSAMGIAREILAKDPETTPTELFRRAATRFEGTQSSENQIKDLTRVEIQTSNCTRYACKLFQNIHNGDSPEWIRRALHLAGIRPLNLIVDLTNLVMLDLGQPLHAFDFDKLSGKRIIVRQAVPGEKLTTLNGEEHELKLEHMVIADSEKPVALAGVMGGFESEVSQGTKNILLESAHFVPNSVRKTRKELGFNTEASYRFERSVDPEGVVAALYWFSQLYEQVANQDSQVSGVIDVYPAPPKQISISYSPERAQKLLGMNVSWEESQKILTALGMSLQDHKVTPPSWRPDITLEEDLIEEVGRIYGYDKIPELPPQGTTPRGGVFGIPAITDRIREALVRSGLSQIISHSLRDKHPLDFTELWRVAVRNPHAPEMAYLRDSTLPGLADAALRNGGKDLHLFEIGQVFIRGELGDYDESPEVGILSTGSLYPDFWQGQKPPVGDFFSLKGIVEALGEAIGASVTFDHPRDPDHRFHPTRQSGVLCDQGRLWVGTVGQIHPDIALELGLPEQTYIAELDILVLASEAHEKVSLKPISRNPAVRRDIAISVSKQVPYREIENALIKACGDWLEKHWLFDVYEGKGVQEGEHSLAIALQLRKLGENFTDEEANLVRDAAVEALVKLGATLR